MLLILKSYIRKMCLLIIIILTLTLITNDLDIAGKNAHVKEISKYILASSLLKYCYTYNIYEHT